MREEEVGRRRREKTQGFFPKAEDPLPKVCTPCIAGYFPLEAPQARTVPRGAWHGRGKPDRAGDLQAAGVLPAAAFGKHKTCRHYDGQLLSCCWVVILELATN